MIFLIFLFVLIGCQHGIEYQDDAGFLVSSDANSPEFPVLVDGYWCQDVSGKPGLCSVRIKEHNDLVFVLNRRDYNYRLHLLCSKKAGFEKTFTVKKDEKFSFSIPSDSFDGVRSFICIGEVFPQNRNNKVSAKFEVRVKVVDVKYVDREEIRVREEDGKTFLVLGKHALHSYVYEDGSWKRYKETTEVEISNPETTIAFSESYQFRVNFFQGM